MPVCILQLAWKTDDDDIDADALLCALTNKEYETVHEVLGWLTEKFVADSWDIRWMAPIILQDINGPMAKYKEAMDWITSMSHYDDSPECYLDEKHPILEQFK